MVKLIEKRTALLAEYDKIKQNRETEKRSAFTNEELQKVNDLKIQIEEIDNSIKAEKEIEEKRNQKLDILAAGKSFSTEKDLVKRTNSAFLSYLKGENITDEFRGKNGNFKFSTDYFVQRATVTAAGDSNKMSQFTTLPVSIIEKQIVLDKMGAPSVQFVSGGGFKSPYLSSAPASYNSEDSANSDITWTAGSNDVVPVHSSAQVELSGTYMKSMSPQSVDAIVNSLVSRIYQGLDKRAIEKIQTAASTKLTGTTGTTYYSAVLAAEKATEFQTGYLFSKDSGERAKKSKVDTASGYLVLQNGMCNGYKAEISSLLSGNNFIAGDFNHVQRYIWDGIEVAVMQGPDEKRKGNYVVIADAFSDAVVSNPAAFATYASTDKLALSN